LRVQGRRKDEKEEKKEKERKEQEKEEMNMKITEEEM
jgi:hypothetical protein